MQLPASRYRMPDPRLAPGHGLVAAGGDLAPSTILAAYRQGIFPWPDREESLLWWSPDPRAILPLDRFHESRSLRRRRRRGDLEITRNRSCPEVMRACAAHRTGTWLFPAMIEAYEELHQLGWVHSIEVWRESGLVGGLYGVAVGGLFAAESMFHRERDVSKIALGALLRHLTARGFRLLDVQFRTDHLASLGVIEIPREEYLRRLEAALNLPVAF